jgi:hypothetical protein
MSHAIARMPCKTRRLAPSADRIPALAAAPPARGAEQVVVATNPGPIEYEGRDLAFDLGTVGSRSVTTAPTPAA